MKIQRTIPPAAAPIGIRALSHGLYGFFLGKRYLSRLNKEVKAYFGAQHVFFVSSGKAALTVILKALQSLSPDRTEVIIPAYTCFSVPSSIVKAGLKIVPCDIDPVTFDFDYDQLKKAITERTLCVVSNHLFGIPSDIDKTKSLCKGRNIFVIEDAAQAMGGEHKGRKLGTLGDAGFFSLGRGKNITCGSGGIIITSSDNIARSIAQELRHAKPAVFAETAAEFLKVLVMSIFIHPFLYWFPSGLPFLRLGETRFYNNFPIKQLSGMHAGLLAGWRSRLEESNRVRSLNSSHLIARLNLRKVNDPSIPFLRLPVLVESCECRKRIDTIARQKGLGVSPMYPYPVSEIVEIREQFRDMDFPGATEISDHLLTLPTNQFVSGRDIGRICRCFTGACELANLPEAAVKADQKLNDEQVKIVRFDFADKGGPEWMPK